MNFIRYAFRPALGALLAVISVVCSLAIAYGVFFNNSWVFIFSWLFHSWVYIGFLIVSWINYRSYRATAPRIRVWNSKKQSMEDEIVI